MPITATLAMVAAAAMAGVPLLNGFLSKEMFFAEALDVEGPVRALDRALPFIATLWGMFSVAYSVRFIHGVFFGPPPAGLPRVPHEPPRWMRFPIEFLVLACLVVGVLPALTIGPFLDVGVRALLGAQAPTYSLAVWHGFTTPLLMSLVALGGGVALYALLYRYLARGEERTPLLPRDRRPARSSIACCWWSPGAGRAGLERLFGTQRLQPQLRWLVLAALVAGLWPVLERGLHFGPLPWSPVDPALAAVAAIGAACALGRGLAGEVPPPRGACARRRRRTGRLPHVRAWWSAPDLALTQLLVEIVTTVLLLLGLRWLPKRIPFAWTRAGARAALPRRLRDLALAVSCGLRPRGARVRGDDAAAARNHLELLHGERLAPRRRHQRGQRDPRRLPRLRHAGRDHACWPWSAISVYALLRRFRPARESIDTPPQHRQALQAAAEDLLVPGVIMRFMFPAIGLLAVYLLLRGHNLPGGGFVAGLTLAVAVILQYMAGGTRWAEDRLAIRPMRWMGAGLLLGGATGAGAWLFAHPFLTSHTAHLRVPVLGELHLPSAFLFDLGVFSAGGRRHRTDPDRARAPVGTAIRWS